MGMDYVWFYRIRALLAICKPLIYWILTDLLMTLRLDSAFSFDFLRALEIDGCFVKILTAIIHKKYVSTRALLMECPGLLSKLSCRYGKVGFRLSHQKVGLQCYDIMLIKRRKKNVSVASRRSNWDCGMFGRIAAPGRGAHTGIIPYIDADGAGSGVQRSHF